MIRKNYKHFKKLKIFPVFIAFFITNSYFRQKSYIQQLNVNKNFLIVK